MLVINIGIISRKYLDAKAKGKFRFAKVSWPMLSAYPDSTKNIRTAKCPLDIKLVIIPNEINFTNRLNERPCSVTKSNNLVLSNLSNGIEKIKKFIKMCDNKTVNEAQPLIPSKK